MAVIIDELEVVEPVDAGSTGTTPAAAPVVAGPGQPVLPQLRLLEARRARLVAD